MKIGCNTVAFRKHDLDFALDRIASIGYEYVEVEANQAWCPHVDPWKEDPVKFKENIQRFGFKGVSALGCHREIMTSEQGVNDIERALAWAHEAEIPIVNTGEGRVPDGMGLEASLSVLKNRLERLTGAAEENHVFLAMEDHGSISLTPEGLPLIINLVKSKRLVVNYDTANIHRGDYVGTDSDGYEWKIGDAARQYSETALLEEIAPLVKHVHFKDVNGLEVVAPGEGEIDLLGCLKILKESGFEGVLSCETEGRQETDASEVMIRKGRDFLINALSMLE